MRLKHNLWLQGYTKEADEVVIKEGELLRLVPGVDRKIPKADRDVNGGL